MYILLTFWLARNEGVDPYSSPVLGLGFREEWILIVVPIFPGNQR